MASYNQCLLFIIHKEGASEIQNSETQLLDRSQVEFYALLPQGHPDDDVCEIFTRNGINLLSHNKPIESLLIDAVKSDRVEFFDIVLVKDDFQQITLLVDWFNKDITSSVFSGCNCESHFYSLFVRKTFYKSVFDGENMDIIKQLVSPKADLRYRNNECGTFLHFAIQIHHTPLILLLLENGADFEARTSIGMTPLHVAAKSDRPCKYTVQLLVLYGANVNAMVTGTDHDGATPLHLALKYRFFYCKKVVHYLLEAGASVEADCSLGNVLQLAVENGSVGVLKTVLSRKPDLNSARNKEALSLLLKQEDNSIEIEKKRSLLHEYGFRLRLEDIKDIKMLPGAAASPEIIKDCLKQGAAVYYSQSVQSSEENKDIIIHLLEKSFNRSWDKSVRFLLKLKNTCSLDFRALQTAVCSFYTSYVQEVLDSNSLNLQLTFDTRFDWDLTSTRFPSSRAPVQNLITRHLRLVKALELSCNESFFEGDFPPWVEEALNSSTQKWYMVQVAKMKRVKIGRSKKSYYFILEASIPQITSFLRKKDVVKALKSEGYAPKFPSYAAVIKRRFDQAFYRRKLLDQGMKKFNFLCRQSEDWKDFRHLPSLLKEQILHSLSNVDLWVLGNMTCKNSVRKLRRGVKRVVDEVVDCRPGPSNHFQNRNQNKKRKLG